MKKTLLLLLCSLIIASFFSACKQPGKSALPPLRIGSITFTEHIILTEMQKLLIERNLGYKVEHIPNFAASGVLHQSMNNGEIDLCVRYLGTELTGASLQLSSYPHDPNAAYQLMRNEFSSRFRQTVFAPLGFQNTYAFALRSDDAKRLGLSNVSGLAAHAATLRLATDTTWLERETDGYQGFCRAYGFSFAATEPMEVSLLYKALRDKKTDVALAYSTDPRIKSYELTLLADDRQFFPPYDAVIVARDDTLERYAGLRTELARLSGQIDNTTMLELNYQVDELKCTPAEVAREFLLKKELIKN